MPQRDIFHSAVKQALINDGWIITHDPFLLVFDGERGYVDLGASLALAAQQGERYIAIEIKSFIGRSLVADLEQAVGQYTIYRSWLRRVDPERALWLAVNPRVANAIFARRAGQVLIEDYGLKVLVVDMGQERIVQWIS